MISLGSVDRPGCSLTAPVAGASGQGTTLQVWGDRSQVLRHADFVLHAQEADGSDLGRADSSFTVRTGWSPAAR